MSAQEVHDAISQRVSTCGFPVEWMAGTLAPLPDAEFVRLGITPLSRRQPMLGDNSAAITSGLILIDCFSPLGAGMSRVHQMGDQVGALFDRADRIYITNGIIEFPNGALVRSPMATGAHARATVQIGYEVYQ